MRCYRIALKSADESNYWFVLLASLVDDKNVIEELNQELNNLRNILGSILIKLKSKLESRTVK
jgi:four helix bundle protein